LHQPEHRHDPQQRHRIGDIAFEASGLTSVTFHNSVTAIGGYAFSYTQLTRVYFQGNAPGGDFSVFDSNPNAPKATAYYLPGTTGWAPTFGGIPTALWSLPHPVILMTSLGVRSGQFGLTVSWTTNLNVVVEAATNLTNPIWSPLATNSLSGGTSDFKDPQWRKHPTRFYRVRSQ
jgi:hypothetical protein